MSSNLPLRDTIMNQLLLSAIIYPGAPRVIAFYGAGGKSTLIHRMASELNAAGEKVLITTTTKILPIDDFPLITEQKIDRLTELIPKQLSQHNTVIIGRSITTDGKVEGLLPGEVEKLKNIFDMFILVEADGSRGKPIKGYADHEPVLPSCSDIIIPVIGADVLGKRLNQDHVHRHALLLEAIGSREEETITESIIGKTFNLMLAIGREQAPGARIKVILNKADLLPSAGKSMQIIAEMLDPYYDAEYLLATCACDLNPVRIIMKNVNHHYSVSLSCVLLAAGLSRRMGTDKLALKYKEQTILEHTLGSVLQVGFKEIILVTGPKSKLPATAYDKRVKIVENSESSSGLSTSLQAGLKAVSSECQGVLFALADMPLISPKIYCLLIDNYQRNLKLFTAPTYRGIRGNPTVFDRRTWPYLMKIKGDQGGKAILKYIPDREIELIETNSDTILRDFDTERDYETLFFE